MIRLGEVTQETIDITNGILKAGKVPLRGDTKSITAATTALTGYPLEAPAKRLYPLEDQMRRRVPRFVNPQGGTDAHWKQITAINSLGVKAGVAEGVRNSNVTLTTAPKSAAYKTLSMSNEYTQEAMVMGRRFEDVPALTMLTALQNLMIQEDRYIIGGNQTGLNAAMAAATIAATGSTLAGGTLTSGTAYSVAVSALTLQGYLNGATGRSGGTTDSPDETIAKKLSNQTPGGSYNALTVTWTDIPAAFAYNVFISTNATDTPFYWGTVTTNKAVVGLNKTSGNVTNTADQTADTLGYSGLLEQITAAGALTAGAYYKDMSNAAMTADSAGGIKEIDTMLASMFNTWGAGPTMALINSQEATTMKLLTLGASATNTVRVMIDKGESEGFKIRARA